MKKIAMQMFVKTPLTLNGEVSYRLSLSIQFNTYDNRQMQKKGN